MQLAYVFWHWPATGVPRDVYEDGLRVFHQALALEHSVSYRLARAPWDDAGSEGPSEGAWITASGAPYEDWYPVADWADLGGLNDRALTGDRRRPHDAAAERAGAGAGGVYRRVSGTWIEGRDVRFGAWLRKPPGVPYAGFLTELVRTTPDAAIWQRQMVLGPGPEFAVFAKAPFELSWPATITDPHPLL